ncbi:DUF7257 domain-containing protein [Nocardia africana]
MMFVVAGRPGITVADDFNRADGGLGSNYTTIGANAPVIATNRAQGGSPGTNLSLTYMARHNTTLATDTQEIAFTITTPTAGSTPSLGGGVFLRGTTGGDFVCVSVTNTQAFINSYIGGTFTNRATGSISTPTNGRLTVNGNVYQVFINGSGTAAATWIDSGGLIGIGASNRSVGVLFNSQNSFGTITRGYAVDDFTARDV